MNSPVPVTYPTTPVEHRDGKFWLGEIALAVVKRDPPRGKGKPRLWRASVGEGVELLGEDVEMLRRRVADWHAGHQRGATTLPRLVLGGGSWPRLGFVQTADSWEPFVATRSNVFEAHVLTTDTTLAASDWTDLERQLLGYASRAGMSHQDVLARWLQQQATRVPPGYERIVAGEGYAFRRDGEGAWSDVWDTVAQCNAEAWAHLATSGGLQRLEQLTRIPWAQPAAGWWKASELRLHVMESDLGSVVALIVANVALIGAFQLQRFADHFEVRLPRADALIVMGFLEKAGLSFLLATPQGRLAFPAPKDGPEAP